jgi:hypothetical protein
MVIKLRATAMAAVLATGQEQAGNLMITILPASAKSPERRTAARVTVTLTAGLAPLTVVMVIAAVMTAAALTLSATAQLTWRAFPALTEQTLTLTRTSARAAAGTGGVQVQNAAVMMLVELGIQLILRILRAG